MITITGWVNYTDLKKNSLISKSKNKMKPCQTLTMLTIPMSNFNNANHSYDKL